jgi:hypothetical protein
MSKKYPDDNNSRKTDGSRKPNRRITKSTKLRKYASVYKSYVRKTEQSKISKSPRRPRVQEKTSRTKKSEAEKTHKTERKSKKYPDEKRVVHGSLPISKKKSLNPYQKFVQIESKKDKYKNLPGKERLSVIATEWKKVNK